MREIAAIVLAGRDLEQLKEALESVRKNDEVTEIKVLYHLSQREMGEWCGENGLPASGYGGDGEPFSTALKRVIAQSSSRDIFLMSGEIRCLPAAIQRLQQVLYEKAQVGAVVPRMVTGDVIAGRRYFKDLSDYAVKQRHGEKKRIADIGYRAVLLKSELIEQTVIDEKYMLPGNAMMDVAAQGTERGFTFYQVGNALAEETAGGIFICEEAQAENLDFKYMHEKWHMGHMLRQPNVGLLGLLQSDKECFNVLEVGCASGANLMEVGNLYPKAQLYGLELNPSAAKMAAAFGEVRAGNIEDKNVDFGGISFDYIIFGDVLEHLHDPQGTLEYCKSLLSEGGKIIASIPNLMHWSVLRVLIDGFFPYADFGLLDRTHIHFFTYYEMIQMFEASGYEVLNVVPRKAGGVTEENINFVNQLMKLSRGAEEFMFWTFQYQILAEKK